MSLNSFTCHQKVFFSWVLHHITSWIFNYVSFAISLFLQRGHEWYGIFIWRSFSIFFVAPLRKKEKEQMNFQQKWKHRFFIFNLINWILQHFQRHIMESTIAKTFLKLSHTLPRMFMKCLWKSHANFNKNILLAFKV